MKLSKQWPSLILGLLMVGGGASISYSDSPSFRTSLSVTLEQLNRIKRTIASEPQSAPVSVPPAIEDLEQNQIVEQTIKEAQADVSKFQKQDSSTVVEAIAVTKAGILIKIKGKEPQTSLGIDPLTEKLSLSLQGAVLATSVAINQDDSAQKIESLNVTQR
ncbi:MAG: hypothetical protein ACRC6M_20215, partial [Microcystaceae cyanobacterium]